MVRFNSTTIVGKISFALFIWLIIIKSAAFGQCLPVQSRVYATVEDHSSSGLFSSVDNAAQAANGVLSDYSTLNTGVLGSAKQSIGFSATVPANTPVTIKVTLPVGLLSVLGGVTLQPYKGTPHVAVGPAITSTALANLLNGAGDSEITIIPNGDYDGITVSIGGINLAQSMNIYDAYYMKTTLINAGCNVPIDAIAGVRANTALGNLATATGSATNPLNAIDADPNSYSELNIGAQAFSEAYHITLFNTMSQPGDTIKMVVRNSGSGLLDLGVLSGFTIQFYKGATPVGAPIAGNSAGLSLHLFPDASNKYELDVSPPASYGQYDRIEVLIGGVVALGLTKGLRIYDVKRVIKNPLITVNGSVTTTQSVCQGSTSTFKVGNAQDCTTYKWYDSATGGTLLQTDTVYTPPAGSLNLAADNKYYVEAVRNGCTEATIRTPVTLKVNPPPTAVATMGPTVCGGTPSISWAYTATNTPDKYSIVWGAAAHAAGFTDVTNAVLPPGNIPVTVPPNAPTGTYNGMLYVKNPNGCVSAGQPISVAVDATPTRPVINLIP